LRLDLRRTCPDQEEPCFFLHVDANVLIVTWLVAKGKSFLLASTCSHVERSTSSLPRKALALYTRPPTNIGCLARDYPSVLIAEPGTGLPPNSPSFRQHPLNYAAALL
jgi:hypothetical protein